MIFSFHTRLLLACSLLSPLAPAQINGLSTELVALDRTMAGRTISTVRIYADFADPGAQLNAVYGNDDYPLLIQTSDVLGFYQHYLGGDLSRQINPAIYQVDSDLR
ncbi:MAG: hypothetical protein QF411_01405, partial [Planctomycetota bacterium]|nr:hypothetical protein [Planctomycetota bacterium]